MSSPDSLDLLRKDLAALAATVGVLTESMRGQGEEVQKLKLEFAVQAEREKGIKDHLSRIDTSLANIYSLGRYFLFAFCTSLIGAFVLFIVKGGLNVAS